MSVTQTAEYALRAVVWLSQHADKPQTTQQLANGTKVPFSYLPKVLQPLTRAQIVNSQRGINGGYSIAIDPTKLTALEVISCVDPIKRIKSCPLSLTNHQGTLCPLHRMLDDSIAATEKLFASFRISDLLETEAGCKALCDSKPEVITFTIDQSSRTPE